jgi:hypothetical protein
MMVSLSLFRHCRLALALAFTLALTLTMRMHSTGIFSVSAFCSSPTVSYRSARSRSRGATTTSFKSKSKESSFKFKSNSKSKSSVQKLSMVGPAAASVLAGSIAGAIGVGIAFPLDTLKTKAQVLSQQRSASARASASASVAAISGGNSNVNSNGNSNGNSNTQALASVSMLQTIAMVYKAEGWPGFFGGVKGMMAGQAVIKALAFSTNAATLVWLEQTLSTVTGTGTVTVPPTVLLLTAACTAGFVTSFVVAPIERIKVMMQASSAYRNEWHCLTVILEAEGWQGLFSRGLGPTLAREIPSYGLYFWTYGWLTSGGGGGASMLDLGALSPLVFGAVAGMAAWIPVYPIDVVKTRIQNTVGVRKGGAGGGERGEQESSAWQVMRQVYAEGGVGAFFDGLTPKLLRAAVNHATTFTIYDLIMQRIAQ